MKNKPSVMVLLLLVLSLYILANPGTIHLLKANSEKSSSSSSDHNSVPPLRQNDIPPTTEDLSPYLTSPHTIKSSIINQPALITPGTELHLRTRFIIPNSISVPSPEGYAILEQEINLYLYTEPDLNAKFDGTDIQNLESTHIINTTKGGQPVTNAIDPGSLTARLSNDTSEGWINCTITLPTMTDLQNDYNITHNDNVAILQYFPGNSSEDAKIVGIDPFWYTDNFTLTGVANIDSQGITNPQSGDETFRQGGNASAILNATSEGTGLENVIVLDYELRLQSDDSSVANISSGITYSLRDMSGNPNTTTDANGNLRLIVYTTTSVNEDDYYFLINASFAGTTEFTENYETGNPSSNYDTLTTNFTIENEMDTVYLEIFDVTYPSFAPPNVNITLVTFRARATYYYTGIDYYPANIPVNATFVIPPSGGVSLTIANGYSNNGSADWGLTDSNGFIVFNITADFPTLYTNVLQDIQAVADFQNNSLPLYPPTTLPNNQPHRFMRNSTNTGWNASDSSTITITPDFWLGEIENKFVNTTSLAPGETAYLEFEVHASNNISEKLYGVPVNFTLDESIYGVSLEFASGFSIYNSSHYLTNSTGGIAIYIHSTHLITPETFARINLTIRIDFEHDSQVRWIGDENVGTGSLPEFNQTWLFDQYTNVSVGGDGFYYFYEIDFIGTNETDTWIRSGDAIELIYKVQSNTSGTGLAGVPVDFDLIGSNPGVSWVYDADNTTDGSGFITIQLITTYSTTPNNHDITINATADFQNDTHPNVWYVGEHAYYPDFWTNTSYSYNVSIITVDPQYFIGDIHLNPNQIINPNATSISQTNSINISFRLKLNDTLDNINGVPISITINNRDDPLVSFGITVLPGLSQNTSNGIVSFIIKTSGSTPQADYNITATAHFGDVKSLTYNITHPSVPSGKLLGIWVNGSINNVNSTFTQDFRVKNVDVIQVQIASINDNSHPDEGYNAATVKYEVYRGTTYLNISGSYKDEFLTALPFKVVRISFNHTGGPTVLANPVTNIDGTFWVNVSISSAIPLEDITIYGWDPDLPTPMESRLTSCNVRLMSTINLYDFTLSGYNGTQIFVGETITGSGSLRDDNTDTITTPLTNLIRISGWNGTHDVGTAVLSNYNGVSYSLNYVIPLDYLLNDINITLSVIWGAQLQHYRPISIQQSIYVYRGFSITSLEIYLPFNTSTIGITNNSINTIYQFDHKSVTIQGVLEDLNGDSLDSKQIRHEWNGSFQIESVFGDGSFSESYPFTGYDNTTFEWRFYHILDNGTTLSTVYFLTFVWEVYDETAPQITITSPIEITTTGILSPNATTRINVTVIDPGNPVYVSVGLDNSSVNITIDGVSYSMTQYSGIYMFYYDWDTSSPADMLYRINITAKDNAGNSSITLNYDVGIDFTAPSATIDVTLVNTYLDVTSDGWAVISGTYNTSGQTYANTSFDTSNSNFTIQYNNGTPVFMLTFDDANIIGNSYSFNWVIYNPLDHLRNSTYVTSEDWRIVIDIVDMAGNTNQTVRTIELDNSNPTITATGVLNRNTYPNVLGRDPTVHSELLINVTFDDIGGIGVNSSTLYFELFDNTTGSPALNDTISFSDPRVTILGNSATLTFNLIGLIDNSHYYIRAIIYDHTSNRGQVLTRTIAIKYPAQPTTTTTTTTTNGGPNGGNPFSGAFLLNLVLLNLLALGGGVGIAVLYERFKTMKG